MKHALDNQHLDFLVSQYVDGTLDAAERKSIEQVLADEPSSLELYRDHRDIQDMLDDYGSRLAMIDWNQFDKQLAARLEKVQKTPPVAGRLRWVKPAAVAASVLLAALLGYTWHGHGSHVKGNGHALASHSLDGAGAHVHVLQPGRHGASISVARVAEAVAESPALRRGHLSSVAIFKPRDALASKHTAVADANSLNGLGAGAGQPAGPGSVSAMAPEPNLLGNGNNPWPVH